MLTDEWNVMASQYFLLFVPGPFSMTLGSEIITEDVYVVCNSKQDALLGWDFLNLCHIRHRGRCSKVQVDCYGYIRLLLIDRPRLGGVDANLL